MRPGPHGFFSLFRQGLLTLVAYAHRRIYGVTHMRKDSNMALETLQALAEPTRLAVMALLWEGREYCVCELMERLDATQSRMSRHMQVLKQAGLVRDRRDAQWVRYRRNPDLPAEVVALVDATLALAATDERKVA